MQYHFISLNNVELECMSDIHILLEGLLVASEAQLVLNFTWTHDEWKYEPDSKGNWILGPNNTTLG